MRNSNGRLLLVVGRGFEARSVVDIETKATWLTVHAAHSQFRAIPMIKGGHGDSPLLNDIYINGE